jgi:hypothetical protein
MVDVAGLGSGVTAELPAGHIKNISWSENYVLWISLFGRNSKNEL